MSKKKGRIMRRIPVMVGDAKVGEVRRVKVGVERTVYTNKDNKSGSRTFVERRYRMSVAEAQAWAYAILGVLE